MKISDFSIKELIAIINGDCGFTPYLSGNQLVKLFKKVGIRDVYSFDKNSGGLPERLPRKNYVDSRLKQINGTKELKDFLELVINSTAFIDENINQENAAKEINKIITNDKYSLENFNGVYKVIGKDSPEKISTKIHFEEIQKQIIEQIKAAKFSIWVAVAWFTDKKLLEELWRKKKEKLNIRIIINDDDVNSATGYKFEKYFDAMRIKPTPKYKNIMHNKFCVIDSKTVIHGSYNWTNKAQWNHETIEILNSRESAEEFLIKFMDLVKIYKNRRGCNEERYKK